MNLIALPMKSIKTFLTGVWLLAITQTCLGKQNGDTSTVCTKREPCCATDWHVPLGIMIDHNHLKGDWGVSYSFMNMNMKGTQHGQNPLTDPQVLESYDMTPEKMNTQMHMAMVMYGVTDRLTLMGMFGYAMNSMSMTMLPGMIMNGTVMTMSNNSMTSSSSGITDSRIYGTYRLFDKNDHRIILSLGVSLPTGSISATGTTLVGEGQRLAYPMQLGSGTFDLLPGISYSGIWRRKISWGMEADCNIKTMNNSAGYQLGNVYTGNAWVSYSFTKWISASLRIEEVVTGQIYGYDPQIAVLSYNDPSANSTNSGGSRTSACAGINLFKLKGALKGTRILLEYDLPLIQDVQGIQMTCSGMLMAGVQYHF